MKTARDWSEARVIELYPQQEQCPVCGQILNERYNKCRFLVRLNGPLEVISHFLECAQPGCPLRGAVYRPEEEDLLALRGYTFGLDVITLIGQRRYSQHQKLTQIQRGLSQQYRISISVKEVQLLADVFLALVTTVAGQDPQLMAQLQALGSLVLSIDGVQPEKGNETLYLVREIRCGRVLAAANLLSSSSEEIGKLLEEVAALGCPIVGLISDHQASIGRAVEQTLPGVPHQLCQFHYLQPLALPAVNEDRHFRKELRKPIRTIRHLERRVQHKQAKGTLRPEQAQVIQDYCLAIRTCLNQDGKYPLEPPGTALYENLHQIATSVDQCLDQHPSPELKSLKRILSIVQTFQPAYEHLQILFTWIREAAHRLDTPGPAQAAFQTLVWFWESVQQTTSSDHPLGRFLQHALKITTSFGQKLFTYLDQPLLPTTNNDMELFIGRLKKSRRQITGRKATHQFVLREVAFVAILFGLPQPIPWPEKFASVPFDDFRTTLAKLRRTQYRSKLWLIRRDLSAYLSNLEYQWLPPPHSE